MNVDMDSIVINIESTTEKATNAIDTLITKLNDLQQALSGLGKSSNNFQKIGKAISNAPKTTKTLTPKNNNNDLQSQLDALKINLKDYDVFSVFKSQNTKGMTSEIIRYKNELGNVVTVEKKMKDGMEDYYRVTQRTTKDSISGFQKFRNSIVGTISKIAALGYGARNLLGHMIELTETSAEYTEAVNLFYTEMGDKAQEAEKWVKKFSDALYLDPSDVMAYMGSFNSLVSGLGVGAENSYKMSKNLTQLAYDLASYKNISYEQAYDKLSSGIAGQIKGLRQVGVALSQNTLQELANEMGIEQRITTMDEASKAQLRYIQIMRSSTNWQADLGKTMMSTENILRSARQQWTLMVRALGDVAAVIVRKVMPYFIALTQLIKSAARALARFLGLDIDFSDAFKIGGGGAAVDLGDIEDGIEDVGGAARKAKKDINTMLAPFDDLNVVQTELEKTGSGVGNIGGGSSLGDLDLPEYDALSKLTQEWSTEIEKAKAKLKSMIPIVLTVAGLLGTMWAVGKIANFIRNLKTIKDALSVIGSLSFFTKMKDLLLSIPAFKNLGPAFKLIGDGIGEWLAGGMTFGEMIKAIAPFLGTIAQVVGGIALVFVGIWRTVSGIKKILEGDTFKGVLRIIEGIALVVAGVAVLFGGWVVAIVAAVVAAVAFIIEYWDEIKTFFVNLWDKIKEGFANVWQAVIDFFQPVIDWYADVTMKIISFFKNIWDKIVEIFTAIADWFNEHVIQPIIDVFSPIVEWFATLFKEIWQTISDIFDNIIGIFKGCWEIIKLVWGVVSQWFYQNVIQPVSEFFIELWDKIKTTAKNLWESLKEIFKVVADWVNRNIIQPVMKVVSPIWETLKTGAKKAWEGIKQVFSTVASFFRDTFQKAWEGVKKVFSIGGKIFEGIKEGIVEAFTFVVNSIIRGINNVVAIPFEGLNRALNKIKKIEILGVKPFEDKISTIHVPQIPLLGYEQGGYPEKASLFWANEDGIPEMVGRIGNKTAVANNDQIATSLTNALVSALSGMNLGGQGTTVVNIGNKKVYEGMGEYINNESERYGTTYITV